MNYKSTQKKILKILDEQISLYQSILKISYEQTEAIKDNNSEKILELVEEKERLIESVKRLDSSEFSYKNISRKYCEDLPDSVWAEVEDRLDELYRILNSLAVLEEENHKSISKKVSGVRTNMETLRRGQAAYRTYVKRNVGSEASFFDSKK